jgi:hypothetical protein
MGRKRARQNDSAGPPLEEAAGQAGVDVEVLGARVEAVLAEAPYWFPVRHHSPAVARHLERAILERRPRLVFIEGPHEANELIEHLVDDKTRPPVAVYSSYRDDDNVLGLAGLASPAPDIPARFACWYPLLAYSPEYVALRTASRVGAECVFMDLPHHALLQPAGEGAAPSPQVESESERLLADSDFYHRLAEVAGYRSWPEAWDSIFEVRVFADHEELRRELATFCAAARATTPAGRIESDGTLPRERFMWRTVRQTLKDRKVKPEEALIVCGGFHLFLDRDDPQPPPEPPAGTVYVTVVPYSFFRVSELSGYAAGNRAPQFYQTAWELARAGRGQDLPIEHVVAVLEQGRRAGEPLSAADAIAVCQHAELLARLRGRPAPVLDDIHDALVTCCCKGDPAEEGLPLLRAIDAAGIGTRVGRVTPALGRLPIVHDFHAQMDELGLGEVLQRERAVHLDLDKRQEQSARRSAFLHRLRFLEVPLGGQTEEQSGDFAGTIFREKWALRWGPRVEPALIEQNLYGDTVESAALARLREQLAREATHAGQTCRRLVEAVDMDLPDLVARAELVCGQAVDSDDRFVSLCQALGSLTVLDRYAAHRNLRREALDDLIVRAFDRACFSLPGVASVPEEQQREVVEALLGLAEVVLRGGREGVDRALFSQHVRQAARESPVPFLRGAFLGALAELREVTPEELAGELSALARGPVDQMVTAGDLLDGILAVSRTSILLGADALVGALDELLGVADWEHFLVMLPRLRGAFERLHERQRDSVAARVAARYGLAEAEEVRELRTTLGVSARVARIDEQVARIMEPWDF